MAAGKRTEPSLTPGPARDLVDLFTRLREASPLRIGQIASRAGYTPSHVSEVLRGWKAPSPDAAARIAQVLGADDNTVRRARRRAEDLHEWKRDNSKNREQASREQASREHAAPGLPLRHQLRRPDVAVTIVASDLIEQESHIAVGFSDTFDTSITDDRIIHGASLQGQLLRQVYGGDTERLDRDLDAALAGVAPVSVESRWDKPHGKLARYPLGTVAVLGEPRRLIFAVAYGLMGNDLVVSAPAEELWHCYTRLWDAVYRHGQRGALSVPLLGSGLARVDTLDRGNLLRLILLSFVSYSRQRLICHELRVVVLPSDVARVDLAGFGDFLRTL